MVAHIEVAIALIIHQGHILVAWRDAQLHQGNCYEFPGGKVEAGEKPLQAVQREVLEETGLVVHPRRLFSQLDFAYPDRLLSLYFYRCALQLPTQHNATWHWQRLDQLSDLDFPAANQAVLARLDWPKMIYCRTSTQRYCHAAAYLCQAEVLAATESTSEHLQEGKWIVPLADFMLLTDKAQQQVFAIYLSQPQHYQPEQLQAYLHYNWIAACENLADALYAQQLGCEALICLNQDQHNAFSLDVSQFAELWLYQPVAVSAQSEDVELCYQLQAFADTQPE